MGDERESRVELRRLVPEDYRAVEALQRECFPGVEPWPERGFLQHLKVFPEGQIGIELDGELVATSSALIVDGDAWQDDHTLDEVTDNGTLKSHEPDGDTLYGVDIAVTQEHRGLRLGRRIYDYRKQLMQRMNLRRLFIAGRIPGLGSRPDLGPEEYVRRAVAKEFVDPTLNAQLAQGFYLRRVLHGYMPEDRESRGCAVLMEWINPRWVPGDLSVRNRVRAAAVQYGMRPIGSYDEFERQCAYYADLASDLRCDFLLYPELLTHQLIPLLEVSRPAKRVRGLHAFTERYIEMFRNMAIEHNVNIIGGTHLVVEDDQLYNVAYLFHRDGRVDKQYKLHITPAESRWWGVAPGSELKVFDTDSGRIAILICYDVEFPELARIAKAKGAQVLFVPYNTDLRPGHIRVRTCAQARCIENNVYAVLSGMCGGLPSVEWAEIHYARSAILTPCDIPFPRDGIGVESNDNVETLVVHDLDYAKLRRMQRQGAVRTWLDRRTDLYELSWTGEDPITVE